MLHCCSIFPWGLRRHTHTHTHTQGLWVLGSGTQNQILGTCGYLKWEIKKTPKLFSLCKSRKILPAHYENHSVPWRGFNFFSYNKYPLGGDLLICFFFFWYLFWVCYSFILFYHFLLILGKSYGGEGFVAKGYSCKHWCLPFPSAPRSWDRKQEIGIPHSGRLTLGKWLSKWGLTFHYSFLGL
jgi:hypothetical protein